MGFAEVATGNTWLELVTAASVWQAFVSVLPVWFFGAVVGLLLPRPKWLGGGFTRSGSLLMSMPPGAGFRRLALAFHGAVLIREIWCHFNKPGTFRRFVTAVWNWLSGSGFDFEWTGKSDDVITDVADTQKDHSSDNWYVTEKDLAFFKYRAEHDGQVPGASDWEIVLDKDVPNVVKYTAWRRTLPNGKTEYKSITVAPDSTAQEFMDMYLDDPFRRVWDNLITHTEVLEHGDFAHRQMVVRWIRSFPFSFLSQREYVIARQMFEENDALYCCSKSVQHHRAPPVSQIVRMDVFYSMWKSRTVECPWGSGKPACETILLHHEQFKIPENLARFAARHGMWGFVKNMSSLVPEFVKMRRARCAPYEKDMAAFGSGFRPNPVVAAICDAATGDQGILDLSDPSAEVTALDSGRCGGEKGKRIRRVLCVAAAVALVVLNKRR